MIEKNLVEKYGALMSPVQVADVLHQHPTHIREMCKKGTLPAVRIGSRWFISTARFGRTLDGFNE